MFRQKPEAVSGEKFNVQSMVFRIKEINDTNKQRINFNLLLIYMIILLLGCYLSVILFHYYLKHFVLPA